MSDESNGKQIAIDVAVVKSQTKEMHSMLKQHLEDSIPIRAQCNLNTLKITQLDKYKAPKEATAVSISWLTKGVWGIYGSLGAGVVGTFLWIIRGHFTG